MKLSLVVPCYHKHFNYLNEVLQNYANGTVKPDQIVISLNGCKFISNDKIDTLENKYKGVFIELKILRSNKVLNRAKARNVARAHITSDIVSFCDADDVYHPQRIEIIKYFFENNDIDHLLHSYILSDCFENRNSNHCFLCKNSKNNRFIKYTDFSKIDYCKADIINKLNFSHPSIKPDVKTVIGFNKNMKQILPHHGMLTVKKKVFDTILFNEKYPRGQDSLYCQEILYKFKNTMLIDAELAKYNNGWTPKKEEFYKYKCKPNTDINGTKVKMYTLI